MCLFRYLVIFVTIVMPCDAALVSRPAGGTQASARVIVYGPLDRRSCTESIGEHLCGVTRIGTELASAMSTVADPHMGHGEAVAYLLDECCNVVLSGCMHSGRLFVEDRF